MLIRIAVLTCAMSAAQQIAWADTIQLAPGGTISMSFAVGKSASTIGFELAGLVPQGSTLAAIPGSTQRYYSGILLQGWLESLDGSQSVPLFDADAFRLGLPVGDIVASAQYGGGTLSEAQAVLNHNLSDAIFGTSAIDSGRAQLVIRNMGDAFTIGLDGYSLVNALVQSQTTVTDYVSGYSQSSTHGPIVEALSPVPEPAVWLTAGGGCLFLFFLRKRIQNRLCDTP